MDLASLAKQTPEQRTWIEIAFATRTRAPSTKREYERDLRRFLRWGGGYSMLSDDGARFILSATYHTIELYHEWLKKQPGTQPRSCVAGEQYIAARLANSSIERYLASLSRIYARLARVGLIDKNPVCLADLELDSPHKGRKRPREYILPQGVEALFEVCEQVEPKTLQLRDKAFLEILFGAGLRLQEISNLKVQNFAPMITNDGLVKGLWIISPKGRVDRHQPIPDNVAVAIEQYLEHRRKIVRVEPHHKLLGGKRGRGDLTLNSLYLRFKALAAMAGIPQASPHSARHTAISNLYKHTKDIVVAQQFAGHKDVSTTIQYLHLSDNAVGQAVKGFKYR